MTLMARERTPGPPLADHARLVVRILISLTVLVLTGMALGGAVGWLVSRVVLYLLG